MENEADQFSAGTEARPVTEDFQLSVALLLRSVQDAEVVLRQDPGLQTVAVLGKPGLLDLWLKWISNR